MYEQGYSAGIAPEAFESLRRTKVFLKAPITTPQGGGIKSLNVTVRKTFGLYANVRPCIAYAPFVDTKHPGMDVVIIRENEEDLYAGIEHQQTDEVVQCLKLISRPGCERIARYAFEYARAHSRKKVTAFSKDNIMKMTDGMFHKIFDEVAAEYPEIESEHWIVDIGAAKLADTPEAFDVVVLQNLYGDILSDVAAQIAGSVGLAGSANIGAEVSMFEAIHGSAPDAPARTSPTRQDCSSERCRCWSTSARATSPPRSTTRGSRPWKTASTPTTSSKTASRRRRSARRSSRRRSSTASDRCRTPSRQSRTRPARRSRSRSPRLPPLGRNGSASTSSSTSATSRRTTSLRHCASSPVTWS